MKYLFILAALYGGYYYASQHYEFQDTLVYAKKHPGAKWAPALEYYVGTAYYQRENYGKAQEAFTQLLTEYPTCQYAAPALFKLGDSATNNREWEVAKEALTRYVEEHPNGSDIQLARKKLELLKFNHQ